MSYKRARAPASARPTLMSSNWGKSWTLYLPESPQGKMSLLSLQINERHCQTGLSLQHGVAAQHAQ